jgi:hypothetical protein
MRSCLYGLDGFPGDSCAGQQGVAAMPEVVEADVSSLAFLSRVGSRGTPCTSAAPLPSAVYRQYRAATELGPGS